jgi:hypothetical protein
MHKDSVTKLYWKGRLGMLRWRRVLKLPFAGDGAMMVIFLNTVMNLQATV